MKSIHQIVFVFLIALHPAAAAEPGDSPLSLEDILTRTSAHVNRLMDQFSNMQCIEKVEQEKLRPDGKVERKEVTTFNYLILLTDSAGELSLQESRIALHQGKADRKNTPMLLSNGFATLFLVFHPIYAGAFHFTDAGREILDGRTFEKVTFEHVAGRRSPAALALRGREYPLELSGTAWIDPDSGAIAKISAGIGDTLTDVGLKSLESEIQFVPQKFGMKSYWLPALASVDVETPRQHWHNAHRFTDFKAFSVTSEEVDKKVAQK